MVTRSRWRAAAQAAGMALAFTLGEAAACWLAGGWVSPRYAVYLIAHAATGAALLGAAAPARHAEWVVALLGFVEVVVVLDQEVLPGRGLAVHLGAALLAAAAALVMVRVARTVPGGGWVASASLPIAALLARGVSGAVTPPPVAAAVFGATVAAGVAVAVHLTAGAVVPGPPWKRLGAAAGLLAGLGPFVVARPGRPVLAYRRAAEQPAPGAAGPNFVLVVLDTVRARSLSLYGYPRSTSPHLEAFARQAVRYARHVGPSSWSLPGHASLFTGLLPSRHGAGAWHGAPPLPLALGAGHPTLAETLSRHGWATAAIAANFSMFGPAFGLDQGFRHVDAVPSADHLDLAFAPLLARLQRRLPWPVPLRQEMWLGPPHRRADAITDAAAAWLGDRRRGQPFFLFLNYMDAHDYAPPRSHLDRFPGRQPLGPLGNVSSLLEGVASGARAIEPDEADHLRALYDGSIAFLDEHLGRLLARLAADPEYDRTWIIVTSDHGESLGEHRSLLHCCSLHEEVVATPLIVRAPATGGTPSPGSTVEGLVQATDILPTLLAAAGLPLPPNLDGHALPEPHEHAISEAFLNPSLAGARGRRELAVLREGDLKFLAEYPGRVRLFDLARDPDELRDVAAERPEDAARLGAALEAWRRSRPGPPRPETDALAPDQVEALRALGYHH